MRILRKTQNCKIKLTRGNSQWTEKERTCEDCTVPWGSGAGHGFAGRSCSGAMWPPALSPSPAAAPAHRALPGTSSFSAWDFCKLCPWWRRFTFHGWFRGVEGSPLGSSSKILLSFWSLQPLLRLTPHRSDPLISKHSWVARASQNTHTYRVRTGWSGQPGSQGNVLSRNLAALPPLVWLSACEFMFRSSVAILSALPVL